LTQKKWLAVLGATLLIPALALAGCGGKKKSDSTTSAQPTEAGQATRAVQPTQGSSSGAAATATQPSVSSSPSVSITTTAGGASSSSIEACRAVTKDEATAAVGETVRDPEGINVGQQNIGPSVSAVITSCVFTAASGSSLDVAIWRVTGTQAPQLRPLVESLLCAQKERIAGLGDVACWDSS
jgi:hypothetical protein